MKAYLKLSPPINGWRAAWLVDECGRHLNTEPVCTIPVDWHGWFADMIEGMEVVMPRRGRLNRRAKQKSAPRDPRH